MAGPIDFIAKLTLTSKISNLKYFLGFRPTSKQGNINYFAHAYKFFNGTKTILTVTVIS